ncbi:hypothetical protein ILUMI_13999 [Ignelater luminosus]|uniref:Uncharacterized protein n=1 Tax=Ignelater luminosus TaxID=2038154 RepID=A0A8K0CTB7_IGNLU|nr:hypothetical protein ILUMI_13999 [Ignelater luminosus]
MNELAEVGTLEMFKRLILMEYDIVEEQLQHPMVQTLLKNKTENSDVVLIEEIFPVGTAFAERFNCPLIRMLSFDVFHHYYYDLGNPSHPILNPDIMLGFIGEISFSKD